MRTFFLMLKSQNTKSTQNVFSLIYLFVLIFNRVMVVFPLSFESNYHRTAPGRALSCQVAIQEGESPWRRRQCRARSDFRPSPRFRRACRRFADESLRRLRRSLCRRVSPPTSGSRKADVLPVETSYARFRRRKSPTTRDISPQDRRKDAKWPCVFRWQDYKEQNHYANE